MPMSPMNVNALQVPTRPQLTWTTAEAQQKEGDFLSLRLLNKRMRIRLSAQPLDLSRLDGKGNYFAVSKSKGWFAAIALRAQGGHVIAFSPLSDLRESITSSTAEVEEILAPKRVLPLELAPTHLAFGLNDERLAVGYADGSISVYDTSNLFVQGDSNVQALCTFPPGSSGPLRQILGNPADLPDLIAVRRDVADGNGLPVEIFGVRNLRSAGGWRSGNSSETVPASIAWSAKGKQLAIGLTNGDIVTYSPADTSAIKMHVPRPPSVGDGSVISIMWLSNYEFYGIYAPPGRLEPEVSQKHVLTVFDPKTNSAVQTELETPYYASPALRPPGAFTVVMRDWDPAKLLIFISDSTSSDIGVVGSLSEDGSQLGRWCNLSLEETSTPSVPLDKDAEDTVPLALDMDLTFTKDGDQGRPPPPVLYLYASDGTLQAWNVFNEKGGSYPGMARISADGSSVPAVQSAIADGKPSGFQIQAQSVPPQPEPAKPAFGQTSTPVFGSSFGQANSGPAFGQTSAFGQATSPSAFGQGAQSAFGQRPSSGFGAFASQGPSVFGKTGFGFATSAASPPSAQTSPPSAESAASPEAEMSEAADGETGSMGGLSLGGPGDSSRAQSEGVNSMFGTFAQKPAQAVPTQSAFGSGSSAFGGGISAPSGFGAFGSAQGSSFIKPASGFGAFSSATDTKSQVPSVSTNSGQTEGSKTGSAFGTSGFSSAAPGAVFGQPAFGQSAFGAPSTFGKPSAFGSSIPTSSPTPAAASSTGGAFSAFAGTNKGFGAFAQGGQSAFGQQAQSKLNEAPSITMATSSDGGRSGSGTDATTITPEQSTSPFGTSQNSTSTFGNARPASSSFGSALETKNAFNNAANATQGPTGGIAGSSSPASPFGLSSQTTNVFGGSQFPSPGAQKQAASAFSTPVARTQTPISSPEGSPTPSQRPDVSNITPSSPVTATGKGSVSPSPAAQSTTPFGTPSPSPFGTGSSVVPGGAFSNLTLTPSAFKPAEGFGAFGASFKVPSSSPFVNPKTNITNAFTTPSKPVSVFGPGGSGPASQAFSTTPTFGTPSVPGGSLFGKSSFGTPVTPGSVDSTPTKLTTSAFGAYSNSGGFSAFAGAAKPSSFSELLKSHRDEGARKQDSPPASGSPIGIKASESSPSTEKQKGKEKQGEEKTGESTSQNPPSSLKGELSFINVSKPDDIDHDNLPPTPSTHGTFDEEDQELGDEQGSYHEDSDSFLSESFSEGSDGVPEDNERGEDEDQEDGEIEEGVERDSLPLESSVQQTKSSSSLSPLSSRDTTPKMSPNVRNSNEGLVVSPAGPSGFAKPTTEPAKAFSVFSSPVATAGLSGTSPTISTLVPTTTKPITGDDPSKKSLPVKHIGDPLVKPPSPGITVKGVSSDDKKPASQPPPAFSLAKPSSPSLFGTTTPPGSPEKTDEQGPVFAPKPMAPPLSSTPSLSLGRPNSRPARSSPLAGEPVASDGGKITLGDQSTAAQKARPASPKAPFGQLLDTAPPTVAKGFGNQPLLPISSPHLPGTSPSPSTSVPASRLPVFGSTSSASAASLAGNAPFIMPSAAQTSSSALNFATKAGQLPGSLANNKQVGMSPAQQIQRPPAQQPQVQMTFESAMQRECQTLYMTMIDEFEQLQKTSQAAIAIRTMFGRPSQTPHTRDDFGDKTKWSFGDLDAFRNLVKGLEKDVIAALELKNEFTPIMREVESNLLKVETRKEEIVRFSKAKADPEFAKMLKARTLGPDAAETQSQLRKQIRLINDRIEQLEAHFKACKKKLEEHRKGKPSIKPPSLDTINRTYRNIDIAIEMQSQQIAALTARVAKLSTDSPDIVRGNSLRSPSSSNRFTGRDLYSSQSSSTIHGEGREGHFRPRVTPSIAASTAAALNAERSALRLKNALSKARKTPLLNTQAVEPSRRTPTLDSLGPKSAGVNRDGTVLPSSVPHLSSISASLDGLQDLEPPVESQRRTTRQAAHAKSVKLGKTSAKLPSSIVSFDWGPLPGAKPMTTLPSDIRPETIRRKPS